MKIQPLYSTKEREKILSHLLDHPSEKINMNQLARRLKISVGQVHKYVSILRKEGIVKGDSLQDTATIRSLRVLCNLQKINEKKIIQLLKRHLPDISGIGIYGSWAKGTNIENADLDLWIKMKKSPSDIDIAKTRKEIETVIGVPVDLTIATSESMKHFREKSDSFYFSLFNGIKLWGEEL